MSADRPLIIRTFNDLFFELLDDVITILPHSTGLKTARRSFQMVSDLNKSVLIKCWYKFVYLKYQDIIFSGDITFFFEKDYSSDIVKLNNPDKVLEIIDSIREPVKDACSTPVNKAHVTTYIQNLSKLSLVYGGTD
jgi:hypothetical protein